LYSWLKKNIGEVFYILPYLGIVKNPIQLIISLILHKKTIKIELINGVTSIFQFPDQFTTIIALLGAATFATSCEKKSNNEIELSFDMENKFILNLTKMSIEDEKLLDLLYTGTLHGAAFIDSTKNNFKIDGKTIKISKYNDKKIIEIGNGIKFYLDSITPGIIIEAFIQKIHDVDLLEDFNEKIVIDVGAECGDTAIYYASRGANVYSFEPIKGHYDAMLKNISLNPELSKKITPINAAVGKDEILKFYQSDKAEIAEAASFVYNIHGKDAKTTEITGYSLKSAYEKFNLKHIDLLKMDCKGCEYFLTEDDLINVDTIKIEYTNFDDSHKLEDLLKNIKKSGFQYTIYRHIPDYYKSNSFSGTLYAKRS